MESPEAAAFDADQAFAFALRLRGDPAGIGDAAWRALPVDAPWSVKVYQGGRRVPLPGAGPWWAPPRAETGGLGALGALLFHAVGVSRVRWQPGGTVLSSPQHPGWVWPGARLGARRPVPSGGAMYPVEVYVVAPGDGGGVFHYDAARHELVDLAHPHPAAALRAGLRLDPDAQLAPWTLVLAHRFGKNVHKYGNFACRLGAVDTGVVLGRLIAAPALGAAMVHVDFDDEAVNAMCGLDGRDESAYAVLALGAALPAGHGRGAGPASPPPVRERGRPVPIPAHFAAMHAAAMRSPAAARTVDGGASAEASAGDARDSDDPASEVRLPTVDAPPVERRALLCRTSNGAAFTGAALGAEVLAAILHHAHAAVQALRAAADGGLPAARLLCAVDRVRGMPAGWYAYAPDRHALVPSGPGAPGANPSAELQRALYAATVDVERAAFTVHVAMETDFRRDGRGARGYRVQQMVVGAAIEAVTRWAAALGAGSHPLHGFDAGRVDDAYGLSGTAYGVEAQVIVGDARPAGALEGSVAG